jgi:hypothetical protein
MVHKYNLCSYFNNKKAEILISAFLMLTLVAVMQFLASFMQQKYYRGMYARKACETLVAMQYR